MDVESKVFFGSFGTFKSVLGFPSDAFYFQELPFYHCCDLSRLQESYQRGHAGLPVVKLRSYGASSMVFGCSCSGMDSLFDLLYLRPKLSLFQEVHCAEHALKAAALRRYEISMCGHSNIPEPRAPPPHPGYPPDAAIVAIRRHSLVNLPKEIVVSRRLLSLAILISFCCLF